MCSILILLLNKLFGSEYSLHFQIIAFLSRVLGIIYFRKYSPLLTTQFKILKCNLLKQKTKKLWWSKSNTFGRISNFLRCFIFEREREREREQVRRGGGGGTRGSQCRAQTPEPWDHNYKFLFWFLLSKGRKVLYPNKYLFIVVTQDDLILSSFSNQFWNSSMGLPS